MAPRRLGLATALLLGLSPGCGNSTPPGSSPLSIRAQFFPHRQLRVAIVGAGASGLTAAETLADLGYSNVTVFEKNAHAGGKVRSFHGNGGVAELGAVYASPDYAVVLGLADKYGIPYIMDALEPSLLDEDGVRKTEVMFFGRYSQDEQAAAVLGYGAALNLFAPWINGDTDERTPPDLALPFDLFAAKYGFTPIAEVARTVLVGFGYAYYDEPALYFMKVIPWVVKLGSDSVLQAPPSYVFPGGYQSVWEAVAAHHDVRFNSEVTAIKRRTFGARNPVTITVNGMDDFDFDVVIISVSLNHVGSFMALTQEEEELFSQVETQRYVVTMFGATGLRLQQTLFLYGNDFPGQINHLNVASNPTLLPDVWMGGQVADKTIGTAQLADILMGDVASLGATVDSVMLQQDWDYFPHVGPEALKAGFYERMKWLQGRNNTFYVGATLNFESVEHSARQARSLVKQHFPRPLW